MTFDWFDSEPLPNELTSPYVEPPMEQNVAGSEPGLAYDATRGGSSMTDASPATDYADSTAEASSATSGPAPVQPLDDQG